MPRPYCPGAYPPRPDRLVIKFNAFMADTFNKRQRQKKKQKKKREKREQREERKMSSLNPPEFMYVDAEGNLTTKRPDPEDKPEIELEDIDVSTPPGANN